MRFEFRRIGTPREEYGISLVRGLAFAASCREGLVCWGGVASGAADARAVADDDVADVVLTTAVVRDWGDREMGAVLDDRAVVVVMGGISCFFFRF